MVTRCTCVLFIFIIIIIFCSRDILYVAMFYARIDGLCGMKTIAKSSTRTKYHLEIYYNLYVFRSVQTNSREYQRKYKRNGRITMMLEI